MSAAVDTRPYTGPDRRRRGDTDRHWRWVLAVFDIGWAAGYAFGPGAQWTSGSFAVIRSWGLPLTVWGVLVLALGLLVLWRRTVHLATGALAVFWAGWGMALMAAVVIGAAESWGGPWFCWLTAAAHGFQLTRPHAARYAGPDRRARVQN